MGQPKRRALRVRIVLLMTAVCTIASFAIPPAANAALLPKKPLDPVNVALGDVLKSVQDLLSQAQPAQAALETSAAAFQAKVQQIIADGQEDPTTIQPAIEALTANPTGIISTTPLTSLALSLAAKAAQPICPIVGALAAETAGVQAPTMPDYSVFGPLADVVKTYDQTGMNTIREYYAQVFAKLLEPITGAPAQAQSVLALANVLLNLIAINWHTTNYPAGGGAPIVHDTAGFLFLPTLVDTDNNLAFDLCVNNGFDLLGTLGVAIQIDRVPLADPNQRTDVQSDFLLKVLHSGYTTPVGSHIPSMFETTHTVAGQPFATKVQWPGDSLTQLYNLAGAVNYKVNTVGTPTSYTLASAKPADAPTGTVFTKYTQATPAKAFSYELQIPNTLLQGIGAANPAPGRFEYCTSKSPYCSTEEGDTLSTQSLRFFSTTISDVNQYGALGAAANGPAPTTCPAFPLLGDAHLHGKQLALGYKTGSGGKVYIDTAGTETSGCMSTAGLANGVLAAGFSATKRAVSFGTNSATTPVALTKSGTVNCPTGTNVGTLTFGLSRYFCSFPPVNTALPTITGQTFQASEMTASTGTWTPPAPNAPTFAFQWERCDSAGNGCLNIAGATLNKYTNTPADLGHTIRVAVTGTNLDGVATAVSNATGTVTLPPAPVNTVIPAITGKLGSGQTLSASKGTWVNAPVDFAYQWQRCSAVGDACADISGANANTYLVTTDDLGHQLKVTVTASNIGGAASATSLGAAIPNKPINNTLPRIKNGSAVATGQNVFEADNLKADLGNASAWTDATSFTYQWLRCDLSGANCAAIGGATGSAYKATHDDIGSTIGLTVTGHNDNAAPDDATSVDALPTGEVLANSLLPKAILNVPDGKVFGAAASDHNTSYIGGSFDTVGKVAGKGGVVPLNATPTNGQYPFTFDAQAKGGVIKASLPDGSGGWYLGGSFTSVRGASCPGFAHLTASGVDPAYCGIGGLVAGADVRALSQMVNNTNAALNNNSIGIGGLFTTTDGHKNFFVVDPTTSPSPTVLFADFEPDNAVNAVTNNSAASSNNTTFFIGGDFKTVGSENHNAMVAYNTNGVPATAVTRTTWPAGVCVAATAGGPCTGAGSVRTMTWTALGVLTGGSFNAASFVLNPTTTTVRNNAADLSAGTSGVLGWNPNANGPVNVIMGSPNFGTASGVGSLGNYTIYLGGEFTTLGGQDIPYLGESGITVTAGQAAAGAGNNAGASSSFVPRPNGPVTALANGSQSCAPSSTCAPQVPLYVGGKFTKIYGQTRHRVALITGRKYNDTAPPTLDPWAPFAGRDVYTLGRAGTAANATNIFIGGGFEVLGGVRRANLAEIGPDGAVSAWAPAGTDGAVKSVLVKGGVVYVGGTFANSGSDVRSNAAAFDAATGATQAWAPNADGAVNVVSSSPSGVYLGGAFANVGGQARSKLAEVDSVIGAATGFNPGTDGAVNAIASSGGVVYVGGLFANAGGSPRNNLAAFDQATGSITSWDPGTDGVVNAIDIGSGGIYVGGDFANIAGSPISRVALLDAAGAVDTLYVAAPDGAVRALKVVGTKLFVGGDFANIGGQPRPGGAQLESDGTATGFNPAPTGSVYVLSYSTSNLLGLFGDFDSISGTPTIGLGFYGA